MHPRLLPPPYLRPALPPNFPPTNLKRMPPHKLELNAVLWSLECRCLNTLIWRRYFLQTSNYSFLWNSLNNYLLSIKSSCVIIFDKVILSPIYYLDVKNMLLRISFTVSFKFLVCSLLVLDFQWPLVNNAVVMEQEILDWLTTYQVSFLRLNFRISYLLWVPPKTPGRRWEEGSAFS